MLTLWARSSPRGLFPVHILCYVLSAPGAPRSRPRPLAEEEGLQRIALESWMRKKARRGFVKKPWLNRYVVILPQRRVLAYYAGVAESRLGNIPLDEHAAIPFEAITRVVVPSRDKHDGFRFNVHVRQPKDTRYPRSFTQAAGTPGSTLSLPEEDIVFAFLAPDVTVRGAPGRRQPPVAGRRCHVSPPAPALPPSAGAARVCAVPDSSHGKGWRGRGGPAKRHGRGGRRRGHAVSVRACEDRGETVSLGVRLARVCVRASVSLLNAV